jgi:hypothetical protein
MDRQDGQTRCTDKMDRQDGQTRWKDKTDRQDVLCGARGQVEAMSAKHEDIMHTYIQVIHKYLQIMDAIIDTYMHTYVYTYIHKYRCIHT